MANKKILLGMLAILLVFGFTLVGCEYGDPGLEGTWKRTTTSGTTTTVNTLTFSAGEYETKTVVSGINNYTSTYKGTYVASNGLLGVTITSFVRTGDGATTNNNTTTSSDRYVIYGSTLLIEGYGVYTKE
jgi:hypothetical protein